MADYYHLITEDVIRDFRPTYLYVKQHNITKLKYFGKTTSNDPYRYGGSGVRWKRHLAKHGNDVSTVWCKLFTNVHELVGYALNFSIKNNIVKSDEWANYIMENGIDGSFHEINTAGKNIYENHADITSLVLEQNRIAIENRRKTDPIYNEYLTGKWKISLTKATQQSIQNNPYGTFFGRKHSEETKKKLCGHNRQTGSLNSQFGKTKTEDVKNKISEGLLRSYAARGVQNKRKMQKQNTIERKRQTAQLYQSYYEIYKGVGFSEFVKITGYQKSLSNLVQQFAKLVPDFQPQNGIKRKIDETIKNINK